jgi:hypothetical protein
MFIKWERQYEIFVKEAGFFVYVRHILVILFSIVVFFMIIVLASPYFEKLAISGCSAEEAASSSGSWGTACDNSYPGTALFNDDTTFEIHQIRKQGSSKYFAGLKINSTNSSISDCVSIEKVYFCYKWWSETSAIQTCDISVDANNGTSYTIINATCPGTSEPGNITCTDVTSIETWTCNNFFGKGALAKSEA